VRRVARRAVIDSDRTHPALTMADQSVVPAKAGTHNHRRWFCEGVFRSTPQEGLRSMGPGVRRDDDNLHLTSPSSARSRDPLAQATLRTRTTRPIDF
jgi:hypothetical protein